MAYVLSTTFGGAATNATGHDDLLLKLVKWLTGVDYPTFSGTGGVRARYVRAKSSAVAETWTITCTNAGAGTFSVVGSVSGAQASATVGTPYDNGLVAFTLSAITGAAVLSDVITFASYTGTLVTAGQTWQLIKQITDPAGYTNQKHVFLRGLGNSGTDQIFVNLRSYYNVTSDYWNIGISGATGYLEGSTDVFTNVPGISNEAHVCLWNSTIPYAFIANGRRFMFIARVTGGIYESAYAGFILPTGTPSEYPYPLAIGGSHSVANRRYDDTTAGAGANGSAHRAFWNPGSTASSDAMAGSLSLRRKSGVWSNFKNYYGSSDTNMAGNAVIHRVIPFADVTLNANLDGSYTLYPGTLYSNSPNDVNGDLEGVYMISGVTNTSENIAVISGVNHFVVQNTYRTTFNEFAAFKLA